ncbi:hypothetical protein [Thalassospira xiamenensis]|uniref:Uncharacterized protein n=1 Tax=Thalassospira xiamenensis TaxID=220697 RepID=A0A285TR07_9PROT|nr:hypothetical protein [Thalassospira xiamenensis]SOC25968.1 hypothetical protein SAMN05428964_10520 [Thalassospira xiamenensis]
MTPETPWAPFTEYVSRQNAIGMGVIEVSSYLDNLDGVLSAAISTSFAGCRAGEAGPDISHFARTIATRVKLESFLLVGPSDCDQALVTLKANLRMFPEFVLVHRNVPEPIRKYLRVSIACGLPVLSVDDLNIERLQADAFERLVVAHCTDTGSCFFGFAFS